jgi:uncharacterized protein (DUF1684 family)
VTPQEHRSAVEAWREARERRLRSPDGWLALVGLWWLRPGANRVGADPSCEVVLPAGPPEAATIAVGEAVTLQATPGSGVRPRQATLRDDLKDRGLDKDDLVQGVQLVKKSKVADLFDQHTSVWHWLGNAGVSNEWRGSERASLLCVKLTPHCL